MLVIRSILAILVPLLIITAIVEGLEMLIVSQKAKLTMNQLMNNQETYFKIRNQTPVLVAKFIYNFLAGLLGGIACVSIAKKKFLNHVIVLVALQGLFFIWGMFFSEYAAATPIWAWVLFLLTTLSGIYWGAAWKIKVLTRKSSTSNSGY